MEERDKIVIRSLNDLKKYQENVRPEQTIHRILVNSLSALYTVTQDGKYLSEWLDSK